MSLFALPFAASCLLALLLGVFTDRVRVDGSMGIVVALVASAVVAGFLSMAIPGLQGVLLGIIGGTSVVPIMLVIKTVRWPDAPIVGDSAPIAIVFASYFAAAVAGAVIGSATLRRKRTARAEPI